MVFQRSEVIRWLIAMVFQRSNTLRVLVLPSQTRLIASDTGGMIIALVNLLVVAPVRDELPDATGGTAHGHIAIAGQPLIDSGSQCAKVATTEK